MEWLWNVLRTHQATAQPNAAAADISIHPARHGTDSVVQQLRNTQIGGRRMRPGKLPDTLFNRLDKHHVGIPKQLDQVRALALQQRPELRQALETLQQNVREIQQPVDACLSMHVFGGAEIIARILQTPPTLLSRKALGNQQQPASLHIQKIRQNCMLILKDMALTNACTADALGSGHDFVVFLFSMMHDPQLFEISVSLAEEILAHRERSFDLHLVPKICDLISSLTSRQLSVFCRLLALFVFEPEENLNNENIRSLKAQVKGDRVPLTKYRAARNAIRSNTDRNHAVLLSIPVLLPRLVQILTVRDAPTTQIVNQIMSQSAELLSILRGMEVDPFDWGNINARGTEAPRLYTYNGPNGDVHYTLKAITLAAHQAEVLFVICSLLSSKRKLEVQQRLARAGLVPALEQVWDRLAWDQPESTHHVQLHGPGCECNPESGLKIQFLRVLHHFVDMYDPQSLQFRRLLMSRSEAAALGVPVDASLMPYHAAQEVGLVTKLMQVFMKQASDSQYRFWLASCIESFLRGSDRCDQRSALEAGLLEHLLKQITTPGFLLSGCLQSNCDLLGEIMKFNRPAFDVFNESMNDDKFEDFIKVVVDNLVDSNVFLRAIFLSLNSFATEDAANNALAGPDSPRGSSETQRIAAARMPCRLTRFVEKNKVKLLFDLMSVITVDDINQENICCLNTALIVLIFSGRQAPQLLQSLRDLDVDGKIVGQFRHLLHFWKAYYSARGRDCLLIELSSRLPFSEWRNMVDKLLGDGPSSLNGLTPMTSSSPSMVCPPWSNMELAAVPINR